MVHLRQISLFLFWLLLTTSCSNQKELARGFVSQPEDIHVLILPPAGLMKDFYPMHPDSIPPDNLVEYDLHQGQFLHQVEDSLLIRYFTETLIHELREFNVRVYTPETIDSFFELQSQGHIFSIAQIQLMEYLEGISEFAMIDNQVFEAEMEITTIVQNTWFEYTQLNQPLEEMEVLFSMQYRSDYIEGSFGRDWHTGEVAYEYMPFNLTLDDVYDLTWVAGKQNAQYIFDFLLNEYLRENIPDNSLDYYQYDRSRNMIRKANGDRFYQYSDPHSADDQEL